jgi:hypothetical protein
MVHSRVASLVVLLALGAAVAGCGGDEAETRAAPEPPELTIPRTDPEPVRTAPETAPQPPAPPPQATEPDYENAPSPHPPPRPDSPENDNPPPAGSPAERFEQECERDPAACG